MNFRVIENPNFKKLAKAGFTNAQFKKLDGLFLLAAAQKIINHRTVDVDFDEGIAEFTYHKSENHPWLFRFVIQKVGPHTMMYELWTPKKGRIVKSGLFDRAYNRLKTEIEELL